MQTLEPQRYSRREERARRRARSNQLRAVLGVSALAIIAVVIATGAMRTLEGHGEAETVEAQAIGSPAPADGSADGGAPMSVTVERTMTREAAGLPSAPATITVSAVGDMIFDRKVGALVASSGGLAPLRHVAALLERADITVGNLESPLSTGGTPDTAKDVIFRGDPRGIEGLKASGFDFLSLANNHVLDYGPVALADTTTLLDGAGIAYAGAGGDRSAAWKPAVRRVRGASVAFFSFSHILPAGFVATDSRAGLAAGRGNMENVAEAIRAAKAEYDYVLVSFHWGVEYEDYANGDQVRDARSAVDAGADMVLSHHPHVIQGIEFYENGLIAYSTGDFVFDHYSRKTGEAFILDAELGPTGVSNVVCTPVYLDTHGAPAVVTGAEATVILDRLKAISSPHGTSVLIENDIARVIP